jgi:HAD superfamily hydrolase (TIGR01662 family)
MVETMADAYDLVILDLDGTLTSLRLSPVHDAPLVLLPNVAGTLAELAAEGVTLAVATNQMTGMFRGRPYTKAAIEERLDEVAALLPMIPRHLMRVGRPGTAGWKPSPDMLLSLLEETGTGRRRALFVGDSESDREAAGSAGVRFAWAWDYFRWPEGRSDRSIDWEARGESIWRGQ